MYGMGNRKIWTLNICITQDFIIVRCKKWWCVNDIEFPNALCMLSCIVNYPKLFINYEVQCLGNNTTLMCMYVELTMVA